MRFPSDTIGAGDGSSIVAQLKKGTAVVKEGWLSKKQAKKHNWVKKYFVCTSHTLSYFKSPKVTTSIATTTATTTTTTTVTVLIPTCDNCRNDNKLYSPTTR